MSELEALLASISPKAAASTAKRLIEHYGATSTVMSADPLALRGLGVSDRMIAGIKAAHGLSVAAARESVKDKPILSSWNLVIDYARTLIGHAAREHFVVLFLDRKNRLIESQTLSTGTVDHAPVYPREVVRAALLRDASALILIHNHPSGDTTPSRADIDMTRDIQRACKPLGIAVHDHIIISASGHTSMRATSMMD